MSDVLIVYFRGERVGRLWRHTNPTLSWFQYETAWLSKSKLQLSNTLPLISEKQETHFFTNLLFEEATRRRIAQKIGISPDNTFELLKRFGAEIAGAIQLLGEGEALTNQQNEVLLISDNDAALFKSATGFTHFMQKSGVRLSLAGAQSKLAVVKTEKGLALPLNQTPSTHILKLPNHDFKGLVENEAAILKCAKALGLDAVNCEVVTMKSTSLLLVERYDRKKIPTGLRRLHQQDFCQAQNLPAELKYEREGGPSFKDCFQLIDAQSPAPLLDRQRLIKWLLFNLLVHNADAHAKNLSFVFDDDHLQRLSPFYDLICTGTYPSLTKAMAMDYGGQSDGGQVGKKTLGHLANDLDVKANYLIETLHNIAEALPGALEAEMAALHQQLGSFPRAEQLLNHVTKRVRTIVKRL